MLVSLSLISSLAVHNQDWILVLQVLLTYANVCSLFTLQFDSLLHFRRSVAYGPTFSTFYTPVPRFSVSRLPPLHFGRCRVFRSRIFSRPPKRDILVFNETQSIHIQLSSFGQF